MNYKILSFTPMQSSGLVAIFSPTQHDEGCTSPVVGWSMVTDRDGYTYPAAMIVDTDDGTASPACESTNFDRLEWQQGPCKCSGN